MEKVLKIYILLIAAGYSFSVAFAADLYFDEGFKQYEQEYWLGFDECLKIKSTPDKKSCEEALDRKMSNDPRNRRSESFFEQKYGSLDLRELDEKLIGLKILQKQAPRFVLESLRPPGVLSNKILRSEVGRVQALLNEKLLDIRCGQEQEILGGDNGLSPACRQFFAEREIEKQVMGQE